MNPVDDKLLEAVVTLIVTGTGVRVLVGVLVIVGLLVGVDVAVKVAV